MGDPPGITDLFTNYHGNKTPPEAVVWLALQHARSLRPLPIAQSMSTSTRLVVATIVVSLLVAVVMIGGTMLTA